MSSGSSSLSRFFPITTDGGDSERGLITVASVEVVERDEGGGLNLDAGGSASNVDASTGMSTGLVSACTSSP